WLLGVGLAAVCALLVAGLQRGLRLLPSPARPPATVDRGGADERRRLGLPDDFRFDGEGELLPARGERLVEVQSRDAGEVPDGLYLRSGCFEVAGLDRWRVGRLAPERRDTRDEAFELRAAASGAPLRSFAFLRAPSAR